MVNWLDRRLYDWFALFFFLRSEMSEMTAVGCGMGSSGPSKLSPLTLSPSPPKFGLSLILVGNLLVRISGERGASRDLGRQPVGIGPIGLGQLGHFSLWSGRSCFCYALARTMSNLPFQIDDSAGVPLFGLADSAGLSNSTVSCSRLFLSRRW